MTGSAVVIGFGEFKSEGFENLSGIYHSLDLLKSILDGGRCEKNPLFKVRKEIFNGTPDDVEDGLKEVIGNWGEEPMLVYVAGHGDVAPDNTFRLPTEDADPDSPGGAKWLNFREGIASVLHGNGSFQNAIVLVDTCHSGALEPMNVAPDQQHLVSQDASGTFDPPPVVELSTGNLDDGTGNKNIVFLASSSGGQNSFEIKPYECDALPTLMKEFRGWKKSPDVDRMTAFAHAIGFVVFLADMELDKLKNLDLKVGEADLASKVRRAMRYNDDGDVTVEGLRDAIRLVLSSQKIPQSPMIIPEGNPALGNMIAIRTNDRARKDRRRALRAKIGLLKESVTVETKSSMERFCKKMDGAPDDGEANSKITQADLDWEEYLFRCASDENAVFVEKYNERARRTEIATEVEFIEKQIEEDYQLQISTRDERISSLENELSLTISSHNSSIDRLNQTISELNRTITRLREDHEDKEKDLNSKIKWWRNLATMIVVISAAVVTADLI